MKAYYQDEWVTLWNCDCREAPFEPADAIITDPPYNVGKAYGKHNDSMTEQEYGEWAKTVMDKMRPLASNQFWVAPRYKMALWLSLLPQAHLIVIPRGASGPFRQGWSDQFETALAVGKPSKCTPDLWSGIRLKGEGYFFTEETYEHPGYTPTPIFSKAISLLSETSFIEPFAGTGTALVAGKLQNRKCQGAELDERWCEIAAKRLAQGVLGLNLTT